MGHESTEKQSLAQITLPNGLRVHCLPHSLSEVRYIYTEIFERQTYTRGGITIADGDCIVDIGANIGMFALYAMQHHKDLKIYCVEPVPAIHQALQANVGNAGMNHNNTVHLIKSGISHTHMSRDITFYPHVPGNSTVYPVPKRQEGKLIAGSLCMAHIWKWDKVGCLLMLLLYPWRRKLFEKHWRRACRRKHSVTCDFIPLSTLIEDNDLHTIDLLKIDVEGSELDVLTGIAERHWDRIRQIVLECSPFNALRMPETKTLLNAK
jgi:FkbM family methyltransferase